MAKDIYSPLELQLCELVMNNDHAILVSFLIDFAQLQQEIVHAIRSVKDEIKSNPYARVKGNRSETVFESVLSLFESNVFVPYSLLEPQFTTVSYPLSSINHCTSALNVKLNAKGFQIQKRENPGERPFYVIVRYKPNESSNEQQS